MYATRARNNLSVIVTAPQIKTKSNVAPTKVTGDIFAASRPYDPRAVAPMWMICCKRSLCKDINVKLRIKVKRTNIHCEDLKMAGHDRYK